MTIVNRPYTGWVIVIVAGKDDEEPLAKSGTQPSSPLVPCPTACWSFHVDHVSPVTMFPASPEKPMTRGLTPVHVPKVTVGSGTGRDRGRLANRGAR